MLRLLFTNQNSIHEEMKYRLTLGYLFRYTQFLSKDL